ncbi:aspartate/glutamate racemase family protein [Tepidimicrobium xylanilyticum]|uniref:Asp/Glu/hydantoin racemase n=1 Tax=Tepidimicrobium xylanilyticum TaxID=1123352 RepID=A0A1H3BQI6_9FIRM|nr:aspartate/glutamate racemase family protein [Tepidimicrobium xylanilyticum]GMG97229.1 putative Asp/Glu racemase [Tepidimicrobium xylanilyticum]SDX44250.1 Asp/Glu/hydantoin racemase [Tepidimicrobium xylanilyticum]
MNSIKILNLLPVIYTEGLESETNDRIKLRDEILKETNNLVTLDTVFIEKGFASLEGSYDVGMTVPHIIEKAKWGQENGYDAIILDCFLDPGLDECREVLNIPVFGACQSACSLAIRLGGEFSVIGILDEMDRCIKQNLAKYGMISRLRSIPVLDVQVLNIQYNSEEIVNKVAEIGVKIVKEDKGKVIVLGCTGLAPLVKSMQNKLNKNNINVPIIEPFRAALFDAISCVLMGVSHSKEAYKPIRKKFNNLDC